MATYEIIVNTKIWKCESKKKKLCGYYILKAIIKLITITTILMECSQNLMEGDHFHIKVITFYF